MAEGVRGHALAAVALVRLQLVLLYQGVHRGARIRDRSSDAAHLQRGIKGTILYAKQVAREHLGELPSSQQILERLVREDGATPGSMLNVLFTARQLDRLRELPPDHKVLTGRDGSPMVERADGWLWRVQPNGSLAPAMPVERAQSTFAPASGGGDDHG
jgi:hypothetical protein